MATIAEEMKAPTQIRLSAVNSNINIGNTYRNMLLHSSVNYNEEIFNQIWKGENLIPVR